MTVSAIVSCYHAAKFVERRMVNLLSQKPQPEVVVVCQRYSFEHELAMKYPVKVVPTDDIPTIGKAWNLAIQNSVGEFIAIANTDDLIYKGSYAYMEKCFKDERVGLVFPRIDMDKDGIVTSWIRIKNPEGLVEDMATLHSFRSIIGPMPMWRRSLHDQFGYMNEDYKVITDYEFTLRLALGGVGFYYVSEPKGLYLNRPDSLEHREFETLRAERLKVRPRA